MSNPKNKVLKRRGFIQVTAVAATTALVVAFKRARTSHASGPAGKGKYSWAMVIDQAKFVYLVSHQPVFALDIMQVLCQRIRRLEARFDVTKEGGANG